jgi:formyl-CoA transferase
VPGIVPKLSLTPGSHRRNAPTLGQDTDAVLREVGLTDEQVRPCASAALWAASVPKNMKADR